MTYERDVIEDDRLRVEWNSCSVIGEKNGMKRIYVVGL